MILVLLVGTITIMPAHAVIVEFNTDKTSYIKGDKITFSGKTDAAHANKMVSIKIYGPNGEFVALTGGRSDANSIIIINPLDTTKGKFAEKSAAQGKGIYNASAIYDEEPTYKGKWVIFDFSLDGSAVSPSAAQVMAQLTQSTIPEPTPQTTPSPTPTTPTTSTPTQPIPQPTTPSTSPPAPVLANCGTGTVFDEETQTCIVAPEPEPEPIPEPEPEPVAESETVGPKKTHIPGFPDPTKDPQSYIDRYNNEPDYKAWFDKNFPDDTIYDIVGIDPPTPASACGPGTHAENGVCVLDQKGIGQCAIATATFGTELSPQVQLLREVRDNVLFSTGVGTTFMTGFNEFYYSFSPTIADWERQNPLFKEVVKTTITPMLSTMSILNYASIDSEQEMLGYGIGVILLNIGMYFVAPALVLVKFRKYLTLGT